MYKCKRCGKEYSDSVKAHTCYVRAAHKDIDLIKFCCNKSEGWRFENNRIYTPHEVIPLKWLALESPITKTRVWNQVYFPLLIFRTCDALGISLMFDSHYKRWGYTKSVGSTWYESVNECRIAAIRKYMEVEG